MKAIGRQSSIWGKWTETREAVCRPAAYCWIPIADLREYLNSLEGGNLSMTDVGQRIRAFNEEAYEPYPNDDLRDGCLAIYKHERAEGAEMAAIVGAIQEFIEVEA